MIGSVYGKARAKTETLTPVYGPQFFPKQLTTKHPPMVPQRVIDVVKMRKVIKEVRRLGLSDSWNHECDQERHKSGSLSSIVSKSCTKSDVKNVRKSLPTQQD